MEQIRAGLSAHEAHEQLLCALAELRRAERSALLCFAEIQERKLYRELGYSSMLLYAQEALGFSRSKTFQFLRLAESFDRLPKLKRAVAKGELSWTKAREVVKVASRRSEARWIREAKTSSRRDLESKVRDSRAQARSEVKTDPCQTSLLDPAPTGLDERPEDIPRPLTLSFSAEQRARFEAIIERVRKSTSRPATRSNSREDLVLEALALLLESERSGSERGKEDSSTGDSPQLVETSSKECTRVHSASPFQIVVYRCEKCGSASVQTAEGLRPLSTAEQERIECDAQVLEPGKRNRATIPPAMRRAVLARDGHRCRVEGCGRARFLEVHHLIPRSEGGENRPENLVTLCSSCHRLLHERGLAEGALAEGALKGLLRAGP